MKPILPADIKGPAIYAGIRDDFRRRIIEYKEHRRIDVGSRVFLVFENRRTLIFQIEEILRAERITEPAQIAEEIEVYNQLLPGPDSLSATLFLTVPREKDNEAERRAELDRFIGLDEHVVLHVGPHAIRAEFEEGRATEDRISAVQYTRFRLSPEAIAALRTPGTEVVVEIDHPVYRHRARASDEMRASLASDFDA
ncbi:MAG TPA: DUF3501 family protein [Kofleriaceae bacterium]|nr:DUF3501 family protein [Kofleriaceae bacterium]